MRRLVGAVGFSAVFCASITEGQADISLLLESPKQEQRVSGVSIVSGWVFSSTPGAHVSVRAYIDDAETHEIPCCSERPDVLIAYPGMPHSLFSGFGLLVNFNRLSAGSHTLTLEAHDDVGSAIQTQVHRITVVKPGGFEFLSVLDVGDASDPLLADNGQEIIIDGVVVADKATEKTQEVNIRLAWHENTQTLGIVHSENVGDPTAGADDEDADGYIASIDCDDADPAIHPFAQEVCDDEIDNDCSGATDEDDSACDSDSGNEEPAIKLTLENPPGALLSTATIGGIGLVSGWVFTTTPNATVTDVRLRIDGSAVGSIPCCSERSDVQTAFPAQSQAIQSGFGALVNFNRLDSDSHTFTIEVQDSAGVTQTVEQEAESVKLGNAEFLDRFDLSTAKVSLLGDIAELENVTVRDKATQQTMQITADFLWDPSCQCFLVQSGCGNGAIESGEECDGVTLGGESCASLGLGSGSLACRPRCAADDEDCAFPCFFELTSCHGAPLLYVTNTMSNSVSIINLTTNQVIKTVKVGREPRGLAVSPDATTVYVTNFLDNSLSVIDVATSAVKATVPVGEGPAGIAVSPDGEKIYTVNGFAHTISVIARATNTLTTTIPVGREPQTIALTADGTRGYVTNFASNSVSVVNLVANTVLTSFLVGQGPNGIALTPDGGRAFIVNYLSNTVSVADTSTNRVTDTVQVGLTPTRIAFAPEGKAAFVTNAIGSSVSVINTTDLSVANTISISSGGSALARPDGVLVAIGGKRLYVALYGDGFGSEVEVFSTETSNVIDLIPVGDGPFAMALVPAR